MMNFNDIKETDKYNMFMDLLYKCFVDAKQQKSKNDLDDHSFWYNTVTYNDGIIVFKTGNNDIPEVHLYFENGFIIVKYIFPWDIDLSHCDYIIHRNIKHIIGEKYPKLVDYIKPTIETTHLENQAIKMPYGNEFETLAFECIPDDTKMTIESLYVSISHSVINSFFDDHEYVDKLVMFMSTHHIEIVTFSIMVMGNEFIPYERFEKLFDKYVFKILYSNSNGTYKMKIYGLKF